jgi:hypothetical protein
MGFKTIVSVTAVKAQSIMASFSVSKKGKGTLFVSVPSPLAGKVWDDFDQCNYALGEDDDAGLLQIAGVNEGGFKIGRMRSSLVFRVPQQHGWSGVVFEGVPLTVVSSGVACLVLKLPDELTKPLAAPPVSAPVSPNVAVRPVTGPLSGTKPPLSIVGTTVELNGQRAKLNPQYFKVFSLLWKGLGQTIRTSYILTSFQDDIDLEKIIGGLRAQLQPLGFAIITSVSGYTLTLRKA